MKKNYEKRPLQHCALPQRLYLWQRRQWLSAQQNI